MKITVQCVMLHLSMAARGHMMPPLQHVCNGLARPVRPANESMLSRDNGNDIGTTGQTTQDIVKT